MKVEKKLWNFVVLGILSPEQSTMRSNFHISLILLFIPFFAFTQSDSSITKIEKTNSVCKTALYYNDNVYVITENGHVVIWNLPTLDTIPFPRDQSSVASYFTQSTSSSYGFRGFSKELGLVTTDHSLVCQKLRRYFDSFCGMPR